MSVLSFAKKYSCQILLAIIIGALWFLSSSRNQRVAQLEAQLRARRLERNILAAESRIFNGATQKEMRARLDKITEDLEKVRGKKDEKDMEKLVNRYNSLMRFLRDRNG